MGPFFVSRPIAPARFPQSTPASHAWVLPSHVSFLKRQLRLEQQARQASAPSLSVIETPHFFPHCGPIPLGIRRCRNKVWECISGPFISNLFSFLISSYIYFMFPFLYFSVLFLTNRDIDVTAPRYQNPCRSTSKV